MGVTIRYDADPSGALDGTREVEDALDGLGEKLGDVGDAGRSAADDISSSLGDVGADAEEAADAVGEVSEGTEGAGVNARSMGSVFKQVLEGDVAGAARAAAPILAGLGPVAALAGVTAFAGLSLIQKAIENTTGAAKADAGEAARWAGAWIDAGGQVITSAQLVAEVKAIAEDPDRYAEAKQNAADWGVTVSTAMRAMAGDATALGAAQQSLADIQAKLPDNPISRTAQGGFKYDELTQSARRGADALAQLNANMEAGKAIAESTSDALLGIVAGAGEASLQVDELGNKLYTLPDGTTVVVDADTGLASQNVETFRGDVDGIPETVSTKFVADTSEADQAVDDFINRAQRRRITIPVRGADKYGRIID